MININLLPHEQKELIRAKRFNLYLTSISTWVIFLIGLIILGLFFLKLTFAKEAESVQSQIAEKQKSLENYNEQKTIIENFNKTVTSAKELIDQDVNWLNILGDLEDATPSKMKLSEFKIGEENSKTTASNKLTISGNAAKQLDIVSFIGKLEKSKYFSNPVLVSSKLGSEKNASYTFEVNAQINEKGNSNE